MKFAACATGLETPRAATRLASQRATAIETGPRWFLENDHAAANQLAILRQMNPAEGTQFLDGAGALFGRREQYPEETKR